MCRTTLATSGSENGSSTISLKSLKASNILKWVLRSSSVTSCRLIFFVMALNGDKSRSALEETLLAEPCEARKEVFGLGPSAGLWYNTPGSDMGAESALSATGGFRSTLGCRGCSTSEYGGGGSSSSIVVLEEEGRMCALPCTVRSS